MSVVLAAAHPAPNGVLHSYTQLATTASRPYAHVARAFRAHDARRTRAHAALSDVAVYVACVTDALSTSCPAGQYSGHRRGHELSSIRAGTLVIQAATATRPTHGISSDGSTATSHDHAQQSGRVQT